LLPVVILAALLLTGCGSDQSVVRYSVSGKVEHQGKPVPSGEITFEPDSSKGNTGPGASAAIRDGVYRIGPAHGVVSGPQSVRIIGFDAAPIAGAAPAAGATGGPPKALFEEYVTSVDIPEESTTKDFAIP